jgi:hypothetical protein
VKISGSPCFGAQLANTTPRTRPHEHEQALRFGTPCESKDQPGEHGRDPAGKLLERFGTARRAEVKDGDEVSRSSDLAAFALALDEASALLSGSASIRSLRQ